MAAGIELLIDGNLISLACHLVVPLCERGAIVAYEAKSVCLHPTSLSDNAEAEFFLDDVTVCLDLQVSFDRIIATGELTCQCETGSKAQIYTGQKHFVKSPPDGPILSVVSLNACSWSCKLQEKVKLDEFMGKQ